MSLENGYVQYLTLKKTLEGIENRISIVKHSGNESYAIIELERLYLQKRIILTRIENKKLKNIFEN